MKILHIDSSPFATGSVSRELSAMMVAAWTAAVPDASVSYRDVGLNPPPHLSAQAMQALRGGNLEQLTAAGRQEVDAILAAIEELASCDAVVIGAPMYNHSIPSNLKAWLDQVCQVGKTFRYSASGPQGLLSSKPVIIASSRGGIYSDAANIAADFQEPYLVSVLALMGLTDTTVIRAEGVNKVQPGRDKALADAAASIAAYFGELVSA